MTRDGLAGQGKQEDHPEEDPERVGARQCRVRPIVIAAARPRTMKVV